MGEGKTDEPPKISRRGFLKLAGASTLGFLTKEREEKRGHEIKFPAILGAIFDDSDGHFRGTWERSDEKPLKNVPVSLLKIVDINGEARPARETVSDQNGVWYFDDLDPGEYAIIIPVGNFSQGQPSRIVIPNKRTKIVFGGIAGIDPRELEPSPPKNPAESPGRG